MSSTIRRRQQRRKLSVWWFTVAMLATMTLPLIYLSFSPSPSSTSSIAMVSIPPSPKSLPPQAKAQSGGGGGGGIIPPELLHGGGGGGTEKKEKAHQRHAAAAAAVLPTKAAFNTTIVTCFFDLSKMGQKTKHPASFYLEQVGSKGTLTLAQPMVIFTDSPKKLARIRAPWAELTRIVNVSLSDFQAYQLHFDQISKAFKRDWEGRTYRFSPLLFTVYYTKPECVKRAIELDYFKTDKFMYMDVGAIRGWAGVQAEDYSNKPFPSPNREWLIGREDRVQMQAVGGMNSTCEHSVRWIDADKPEHVPNVPAERKVQDAILVEPSPRAWWIAGAIFTGTKKALLQYYDLYMYELDRYLAAGFEKYTLDDQFLMGALACRYDLIEVVRPPEVCCSKRLSRMWFFMLLFFRDAPYPTSAYSEQELLAKAQKALAAAAAAAPT